MSDPDPDPDHDVSTELNRQVRDLLGLDPDPEDDETPGLPIREAETHDIDLLRDTLIEALDHIEGELEYRRENTD